MREQIALDNVRLEEIGKIQSHYVGSLGAVAIADLLSEIEADKAALRLAAEALGWMTDHAAECDHAPVVGGTLAAVKARLTDG